MREVVRVKKENGKTVIEFCGFRRIVNPTPPSKVAHLLEEEGYLVERDYLDGEV